ncbi:MAG: UvrD-helicase domain-containing protein, partial [Candidatus Thermoplasmatota archaeon]|nr:UvrD-helicase domain-containing protein [Candidatus Thermoplasmatota archaeon]
MKLTDRQEETLDIRKNIAVTAGAGSGKTRVLVERYISILRNDDDVLPRNILALTFTDKAASGMKERIRSSVKSILDEDPQRWSRVLDDLGSSDISTIHSFCTRLVRNDPIPCGIDPDLRILTETEAKEMLRGSVNELLTVDGKESRALRRLLVDHGTRSLTFTLMSLVRERSKTGMKIGSDEFRTRSLEYLSSSWKERVDKAVEELGPFVEHLIRLKDVPVPDMPRDTAVPLMKAMQPVFGFLQEFDESRMKELLPLLNGAREHLLRRGKYERGVGRLGNSKVWGADHGALKECFSFLFPFAFRHREILSLVSNGEILRRSEERVTDLIEVFGGLGKRFDRKKRSANGLDFDDQISYALMLLQGGSPSLLENLRRRYSHILVDEFQDTDPRQWKLVELLWNGGKGSKLFIVGDPKQSIYGFRSADVRLFRDAKRVLDEHSDGECIVLDRNFRSRKEIMDLVNALFPYVMEKMGSRWEVLFDPLEPHREEGGSVTVVGVIGSKGAEAREGAKAAEIIKRAVRGWSVLEDGVQRPLRFNDIAILLPTRKGFQHYEDAMRAENIPYQVYKGKGFFERQEVKDVLSMLSFVSDPRNDLALASLLKGPFFGYSDEDLYNISLCGGGSLLQKMGRAEGYESEEELLRELIEVSRSRVPYMALWRMFKLTGAYAVLGGARGSRNLDRLIEWAIQERSALSIHDLKERLLQLTEDPPKEGEPLLRFDEESVTVMTIHSAKGLEWPMVLVLGMNHEARGGWTRPYNLDPEKGLSIKVMDTSTGELVKTPSFIDSEEDLLDKEVQERKRLFYVACTRARDHLVLSGAVPVDRMGNEREPYGMMRFLWNSMDLSLEELGNGVKVVGDVPVNLVLVGKEEVTEDQTDEEEDGPLPEPLPDADPIVVMDVDMGREPTFLGSPSNLLRSEEEIRGIPAGYP